MELNEFDPCYVKSLDFAGIVENTESGFVFQGDLDFSMDRAFTAIFFITASALLCCQKAEVTKPGMILAASCRGPSGLF